MPHYNISNMVGRLNLQSKVSKSCQENHSIINTYNNTNHKHHTPLAFPKFTCLVGLLLVKDGIRVNCLGAYIQTLIQTTESKHINIKTISSTHCNVYHTNQELYSTKYVNKQNDKETATMQANKKKCFISTNTK